MYTFLRKQILNYEFDFLEIVWKKDGDRKRQTRDMVARRMRTMVLVMGKAKRQNKRNDTIGKGYKTMGSLRPFGGVFF